MKSECKENEKGMKSHCKQHKNAQHDEERCPAICERPSTMVSGVPFPDEIGSSEVDNRQARIGVASLPCTLCAAYLEWGRHNRCGVNGSAAPDTTTPPCFHRFYDAYDVVFAQFLPRLLLSLPHATHDLNGMGWDGTSTGPRAVDAVACRAAGATTEAAP